MLLNSQNEGFHFMDDRNEIMTKMLEMTLMNEKELQWSK